MSRTRDFNKECVSAELRTQNGTCYLAQVLQTTVAGDSFFVDLRFVKDPPGFMHGDEVAITFMGIRIRGQPTADFRFVGGTMDLTPDCARFQTDLLGRGGLARLVERRGAERLAVATAPLVEVRWNRSKLGAVWRGTMVDISSRGLQVDFAASNDPDLQVGHAVRLAFTLQGDDEPFELGAELQYRRPGRGRVSYGMEFLREPNDAYRILEGRLFGVLIDLACSTPSS